MINDSRLNSMWDGGKVQGVSFYMFYGCSRTGSRVLFTYSQKRCSSSRDIILSALVRRWYELFTSRKISLPSNDGVHMVVLVISAHADDGEAATGGTIHQMAQSGMEIHYLAFSIAEESVPQGFERDIVGKECLNATKILGIPSENVRIYRFKVRHFSYHRQEILEELTKIKREIKPTICFTPSTRDIHQDHKVVCEETIRAFQRSASIYGYDFPWNVLYAPKLNMFSELSEANLEKKIQALQCYRSQLVKPGNYFTEEYIRSLALIRGNMIGVKYAEAFETIREIRWLGR